MKDFTKSATPLSLRDPHKTNRRKSSIDMISTKGLRETTSLPKQNIDIDKDNNAKTEDMNNPMTPSPPNKLRRSSSSMGFLPTPKFNALNSLADEQNLSHRKLGSPNFCDNGEEINNINDTSAIALSPIAKTTRLLPPTTPKSRNIESFLSPSPKLTSPHIYKESNKPIREISNNLKTRLNYAFVKLQNGWIDRTLPELENELDGQNFLLQARQQQQPPSQQSPSHYISNSYINRFAHGNGSSKFVTDSNSNAENSDSTNSARLAFMKALSSPMKQEHSSFQVSHSDRHISTEDTIENTSPLKWTKIARKSPSPHIKKENEIDNGVKGPKKSQKKGGATEVAAIETLMSLSSPKKSKPTTSFTQHSTQDSDNDTEVDMSDNSSKNDD